MPHHGPASAFRLGDWVVKPELHRIEGPGGVVRLEPRVMSTLLCLAEQPGRPVSRDEILERVWGDTVVDEETLTHAISDLRAALEDDAREPRYIETIIKGGYRIIARVERLPRDSSLRSQELLFDPDAYGRRWPWLDRRLVPWLLVVMLVAIAVVLIQLFGNGD